MQEHKDTTYQAPGTQQMLVLSLITHHLIGWGTKEGELDIDDVGGDQE